MFGAEFLSQHELERRRSVTAAAIPYVETLEAAAPTDDSDIAISFDRGTNEKNIPFAQSVFVMDPSFSLSAQEYANTWSETPPT